MKKPIHHAGPLLWLFACKEKESPPVFTSPSVLDSPHASLAEFAAAVSGDGVTYQWQKNVGGQWMISQAQ